MELVFFIFVLAMFPTFYIGSVVML